MTQPESAPADVALHARRTPSLTVRYLAAREPSVDGGEEPVRVWFAVEEEIARVAEHAQGRSALSDADWARWERLRVEGDRERFLAARILLRFVLSTHTGVSPEVWRFESDEYGRPHITGPTSHQGIPFSITHTSGLVACAVTRSGDVGVDAEAHDRESRTVDVAHRFFSAAEVACLDGCSPEQHRDLFFDIWTLKEAYVKALGRGLTLPLDRFSFDLSVPPPQVLFETELGDAAEEWAFALERPTQRHSLAVAVRGGTLPGGNVHMTRVTAGTLLPG